MAEGLTIIFLSGAYRRVHFGLAMAAAALATNRPTTLFFTMEAIDALIADKGWRDLDGDRPAEEQDAKLAAEGVGTFEELLEGCAALGGRFIVCDMGLRAMRLAPDLLRDDIAIEIAGLATLYAESAMPPTII